MHRRRPNYPVLLSQFPLEDSLLDGFFQSHKDIDPNQEEKMRFGCPKGCGNDVVVPKSHYEQFAQTTVCDECVEKRTMELRIESSRYYWRKICPSMYRKTDIDDEEFNINAYKRALGICKESGYTKSIVLYGRTGTCKSRIACEIAKMALLNEKTIALYFPDDLKDKPRFETRKQQLVNLTAPDFIVLDDFFISGASREETADFKKDLIDRRMRHEKTTIITSQSTGEDFASDANKFGTTSTTEMQRIEAIVRRVREEYECVDCGALEQDDATEESMF